MPPKGKRRANALVTRDAFELLRLVDGEGMLIDDAMKQLKLSRSRAYDLLGRARMAVLRSQNEANKKAAEVNTKRWYEAVPDGTRAGTQDDDDGHHQGSPEPHADAGPITVERECVRRSHVGDAHEDVRAVVRTEPEKSSAVVSPVSEPEPVWEWEHLKPYGEFMSWPEHRREQWLAQVRQNEALGGVRWTPVLRGGIKNRNCFRGCPSYQCTCEENL
jgi:predicted DNA-binding protein (UPF0251 family)